MHRIRCTAAITLVLVAAGTAAQAQPTGAEGDPCRSLFPAVMGGPILREDTRIALRWLSTANYELVYRGQVFLLDAYFDQGPRGRPTGVVPEKVVRTDAIFIGHGHYDHMSDAAPIAQRTGSKAVGAPITIATAEKLGLPSQQGIAVTGGETLQFRGMTVDAALAQHSMLAREPLAMLGKAYELDVSAPTPEQATAEAAIAAKGTLSQDVLTKGTIAYGFTFATGFKLVWLDSAGSVTEGVRALAAKLAPVDIAIISYAGHPVAEKQVPITLEIVKLLRPRIFLPTHHDLLFGVGFIGLDFGVEPLFEAIQDALPGTETIAPLHRRPMCFDISK
jgi:L-ascorbate metabolism protein UlaG (beta-lactamase superfamily)